MNEQQLQQILTIQQAIAAAATAAVINSLLNPQQQQQQQQQLGNGGASSPASQIDSNNRTAQELLLHLQQQAVAANLAQQQQQQQQQQQHHQHHNNDADQQQDRPDSRLDSPAGTSSPANNQQVDINNQTIQNLLVQLQQQAAGANPLSAISNASALAALNLNLNNQLPSQMPNMGGGGSGGSPINRSSSMVQNDPFLSASPTTSGNMQQQANNQMPSNKKLKRYHQPQPNQLNRSSHDATSKPHSSPKNHSTISNLAQRNNSSSTTNSSSSSSAAAAAAFLPNNVGLPRKLVRGQDVWLGRGAEQTRQILKCMWCGQSFRTLAEMTQHMKVTQHYTNIISQEQITSWKQPESSETNTGKQSSRQSNQAKMLDESLDTSSEKFNESDRDDSFSNDDEPPEKTRVPKSRQSSASKVTNNSKAKRDSSGENREATEQSLASLKSPAKNRKRARNEDRDTIAESPVQDDSDAENSSASAASSHRKSLNNSGDALKGNDEDNKPESSAASPDEKIKHESGVGERSSHPIQSDDGRSDDNSAAPSPDLSLKPKLKPNGDSVKSPASVKEADDNDDDGADDYDDDDQHSELDEQVGRVNAIAENDNDEDEAEDREKMSTLEDVREHNNDDCDKITRKRSKDKGIDMDVIKQVAEVQKGDGTGDPLSALETMVEKSFDPRMRPGMASGGILQRLGIDEEVCPPWQHINYANWYAAAAYGHPMAAALLAAGMNLQNGIKLSKNMNQKKGDD